MISKNTIKLIKSLAHKKYRLKENLFLVEGDKTVAEVLNSGITIEKIFATTDFLNNNNKGSSEKITEVSYAEIKKASLLKNPQQSLAICRIPVIRQLPKSLKNGLSVYLDEIQDPGNLGTIIRICDWFGVEYLFCSPTTVDVFNPKVIQASMGSFIRVPHIYTDFEPVKKLATDSDTPVFGAFLEGKNIYSEELSQNALLVMGNEGNGISSAIEKHTDIKIKIPSFSKNESAESLNVSVATAIICSEFKRRSRR